MAADGAKARGGFRFFGWLVWSGLVFAGGYAAAEHDVLAPLIAYVHERVRAEANAPPPSRAPSAAGDARELLARIGDYARAINTRKSELSAGLKESQIALKLLEGRGESADGAVLRRLRDEQAAYQSGLGALDSDLGEALELESRLQVLVDAAASVDAADVGHGQFLLDAHALLTRLDHRGLR